MTRRSRYTPLLLIAAAAAMVACGRRNDNAVDTTMGTMPPPAVDTTGMGTGTMPTDTTTRPMGDTTRMR